MNGRKLLCPSILNLPIEGMREEIIALDAADVDIFHIDIMDGHFTPSFGMAIREIDLVRKYTNKLLDCHMMVLDPIRYVELVAQHGCDIIYIHPEADRIPTMTLAKIKALGKKAGIVINPGTSLESVRPMYPLLDYFMVMTVNPGFAGQPYLDYVEPKIDQLLKEREDWGFHIVIDGGVDETVMRRLYNKGVEGFVLGKQLLFEQGRPYSECVDFIRSIQ